MKILAFILDKLSAFLIFTRGARRVLAWRFREKGWRSALIYLQCHGSNLHIKFRNAHVRRPRMACPCCGWTGYDFLGLDGTIFYVPHHACPNCDASARHRVLHLYLHRHDRELWEKKGLVVHYAPEDQVRNILKGNGNLQYAGSDLGGERLVPIRGRAFQSNILAIPLAAEAADVVFCLHLLEHLEDDTAGIAEIHRVMRPGAIAYIMVPIDFRIDKSVFFGRPHPDIFAHYWSHALDFKEKLADFEYQEIRPQDFLSRDEQRRFGVPDDEIIYRCVKR